MCGAKSHNMYYSADTGDKVLHQLHLQRMTGKYCDLVIKVFDREFSAHKNVIAACCPKIQGLLNNDEIRLDCSNSNAFEAVLEYFYTGKIELFEGNLPAMLQLSTTVGHNQLRQYCFAFMEQLLDVSNCFHLRHLASLYNVSFEKTVESFVYSNLKDIFDQNEVLEFNVENMEALIADKSLPCRDELKVYVLVRWAKHDVPTREGFSLYSLLRHIKWQAVNTENIYDLLKNDPLFYSSEKCLLAFLTSLFDAGLLKEEYIDIFRSLKDKHNIVSSLVSETADSNLDLLHFNSGCFLDNLLECSSANVEADSVNRHFPENPPANRIQLRRSRAQRSQSAIRKPRGRPPRKVYSTQLKPNSAALVSKLDISLPSWSSLGSESEVNTMVESYKTAKCCEICAFTTRTQQQLVRHVASAHKTNQQWSCCLCDFVSMWKNAFLAHMRGHFSGPPFCCDFADCSYESERIQVLLTHRMIHTNEAPLSCEVCSKRFRTDRQLKLHQRKHTGEKPFTCSICNVSFATKATLNQHRASHGSQKKFKCETCNFAAKYQSTLAAHRRIHAGDVYRCQETGCSFWTPKKSTLGSHVRAHRRIRAHQCAQCGKSFVELSHLRRHAKLHNSAAALRCGHCVYSTTRNDKMKEHQRKYHGDEPKQYKPKNIAKKVVISKTNAVLPNSDMVLPKGSVVMQKKGLSLPVAVPETPCEGYEKG